MKTPKQIDDGGTAFPVPSVCNANGDLLYGTVGMTLRDYFAAAALQGMICHYGRDAMTDEDKARDAYELANAMIAARKGGA